MRRANKFPQNDFYKGRYHIVFYAEDDDEYIAGFNSIKDICLYKEKPITSTNLNMIRVELYRALKNEKHETYMLDNKLRHVYLIDVSEDILN